MALPKICEKMVSKVLATTDKLAIKYLDGHSEEITKDTLSSVTGVKGEAESSYRKGAVNITKADIGLGDVQNLPDNQRSVKTAAECTGNSATASKLKDARNLTITDATGANKGTAQSFDGSNSVEIKLPSTIKANVDGLVTGNISGNISGNAATATKLATARKIGVTGDATGEANFDGSNDASISLALKSTGVTSGSYGPTSNASPGLGGTFTVPQITVDNKGRVTGIVPRIITLPSATTVSEAGTTYSNATSTTDGLMSSTDKQKLDGIAAEATRNVNEATTTVAGLMSASDKTVVNALGYNSSTGFSISSSVNFTGTTFSVTGNGDFSTSNGSIGLNYKDATRGAAIVVNTRNYETIPDKGLPIINVLTKNPSTSANQSMPVIRVYGGSSYNNNAILFGSTTAATIITSGEPSGTFTVKELETKSRNYFDVDSDKIYLISNEEIRLLPHFDQATGSKAIQNGGFGFDVSPVSETGATYTTFAIRNFNYNGQGNNTSSNHSSRILFQGALDDTVSTYGSIIVNTNANTNAWYMTLRGGTTENAGTQRLTLNDTTGFSLGGDISDADVTGSNCGIVSNMAAKSLRFHNYSEVRPNTNGKMVLGTGSYRWGQIYSSITSISSSDARVKRDVTELPNEILDVWANIKWEQFKFIDSVNEKGENARLHIGLIAQKIQKVFENHNFDASKYGFFCFDKWDAKEEIIDVDGTIIQEAQEAGELYSLRYTEALCIEAAYQRRRADRLEARVNTLETQLKALESRMAALESDV